MTITASALERISRCPASEALPHVKRQGEWASRGTAIHSFLEMVASGMGAAYAISKTPPEHQEACAILALEDLPAGSPGSYAAEVALAFDVETFACRELGRGLGRDYAAAGLKPTEIAGTADCIGVSDDAVVVLDYKSGYAYQAADSHQMRFLGMAAGMAYGKSKAHLLTLVLHDDQVIRLAYSLCSLDFAKVAVEVKELLARVEAIKASGRPHEHLSIGTWCRHCPAMTSCSAQVGMIRELARHEASPKSAADIASQLTVHEASITWGKIKAAKVLIERLDEAVRLFAANNPVPIGGNRYLGMKEKAVESLEGGCVHKVIKDKFGVEAADSVVTMSATKSGIDEFLRTRAASTGEKMSALKKDVLDAVRALGGAKTRTSQSVIEYTAKGEA